MKSLAFSRKVALRYLWSRRSEAFISIITIISILGVAIGVMVLNIVMAVMTGFEYELREKIVNTNSHIVVRRLGGKIFEWEDVAKEVASVPGVESVSPFTYNQALLRAEGSASGLLIKGITPGSSAAEQLGRYMGSVDGSQALFNPPPVVVPRDGEPSDSVELPGLIVGRELARSAGLLVGMPVSLLSPQVSSSPFGLVPRFRRFVVAGIYSSGLVEYESGLAYARLEDAQRFFEMDDSIYGLEVRVHDIYKSAAATQEIMTRLSKRAAGFFVQDWTETNRPLWEAIRLEKKVYFLVLLLIVVMASFSIITTLIMIVIEKRKDIAVLKTMGASTAAIANIFRIQGGVIGVVGTGLGLLSGYLGCVLLREYGFPIDERIFQMSSLPVRIEPLNFLITGVAAFLICFLATVYPARRAAALHPSEALRYE